MSEIANATNASKRERIFEMIDKLNNSIVESRKAIANTSEHLIGPLPTDPASDDSIRNDDPMGFMNITLSMLDDALVEASRLRGQIETLNMGL